VRAKRIPMSATVLVEEPRNTALIASVRYFVVFPSTSKDVADRISLCGWVGGWGGKVGGWVGGVYICTQETDTDTDRHRAIQRERHTLSHTHRYLIPRMLMCLKTQRHAIMRERETYTHYRHWDMPYRERETCTHYRHRNMPYRALDSTHTNAQKQSHTERETYTLSHTGT
jgi:hypothetical protein